MPWPEVAWSALWCSRYQKAIQTIVMEVEGEYVRSIADVEVRVDTQSIYA